MYSVSSRFLDAIRRGVRPVAVADILYPTTGGGTDIIFSDLPISSGRISVSRNSKTRGSGNLTIPDQSLSPVLTQDSPLNPYGYEVRIRVGYQYHDGQELIPMGIYGIEDASVDEDGITAISFFDRAKMIERADFTAPKDYSGWYVQDAIADIVLYASPFYPGDAVQWDISFASGLTNPRLPGGTVFNTQRWTFLDKLTETMGAEAYFDRDGDCRVIAIPSIDTGTPLTSVAWEVDTGENGVLISSARKVTRAGVYNAVFVSGATNDGGPQISGFASDDNPNSRTYYLGPFGKSVKRIENSALTTETDCVTAARAALRNLTGLQKTLSFNSLRNPALDLGDVLLVKHLDGQQSLVMLDDYSFDFSAGDMTASIRSVQYA